MDIILPLRFAGGSGLSVVLTRVHWVLGIRTRGGHAGLLSLRVLLVGCRPREFVFNGPVVWALVFVCFGLDPVRPGSFNKSPDGKKKSYKKSKKQNKFSQKGLN